MKINITQRTSRYSVNFDLLKKEFEIVDDWKDADIILCESTVPNEIPKERYKDIILLQRESPLTSHRIWTYENFDKFHTVFVNNPNGTNQFNFTDKPIVFPWSPLIELFKKREDTTLKTRNIFFAGKKSQRYASRPDRFGCSTLYDVRDKLVSDLSKFPTFKMYGVGWDFCISGKSTKAIYTEHTSWIPLKIEDISDSESDFVICMENTIQPNLIADKIHDGFNSDRAVLYFGEQNIEKYVPKDCFVDLRPYFDKETKKLDAKKIYELTQKMTQEEYDKIINNAREWRKTLVGLHEIEEDKLTKFIIERIKCQK